MARSPMVLALAAVVMGLWLAPALAADPETSGELRLHGDARSRNPAGPLAAGNALDPGIAPATPSAAVAEAELRGHWRPVSANLLLWSERPEGGATQSHARVNELYASGDFGAWQASAGKKIVGWDVGYGFRPNDVVQQEQRRTLLTVTPEGRPLLQLEHFDAETATSLVWVNPQRIRDAADDQRNAGESALAARWYQRSGAADWHLFGRWGEHTGASLGAALAWVATEELELHASLRALQRHDGWRVSGTAGNATNPWRVDTLGGASQVLLGASWTGAQQQSLIVEWWHDGTALADADWDRWRERNRALATLGGQPGLPAGLVTGIAGNLAWQASPFNAPNLRRDNLFVRLAWQPEHWLFSLDALLTPADRGRTVTAAVQWQGDRLRINAAWRVTGGPADALLSQLPQRRSGVLAATWAF
ncbi:hypothetical protein [Piscinibacter sp.]|jgi:hypothetical protein|uniref:hypothetical protein n=1 Tax=Piscinibacter sp. TaxID=1903157 RepID=UPI002F411E49